MARIAFLLLSITYVSCMEMKETVERMVMVRTTGSDLQPAATGFIYKKESDGPASVVKMGESEIVEQLSKLYIQPKSFAAPIPIAAGPFYAKEEDVDKAASTDDSHVIPVVEVSEDDVHEDGIANEEYEKLLKEYADNFGNHDSDFDDYLESLGYFKDGHYYEHGDGSDDGSNGHHEDGGKSKNGHGSKHYFQKGDAGDYHNENHESFSISSGGDHQKDFHEADGYGAHYAQGNGFKGGDHVHKGSHSKGEEVDGYHKVFDKDEFKKDHDFYDGEKVEGDFSKFGKGHDYYGSDSGGFKKGGSHESGHHEEDLGKSGFHDKESEDKHGVSHSSEKGDDSYHHHHGEFGADGGKYDVKSYGFEVKH